MSETFRHRSRGTLSAAPNSKIIAKDDGSASSPCSSGIQYVYSSSPSCKVGTLEEMDDVVVANFRKRQKAGEFVFNPLSHRKVTSSVDQVGSGPAFRHFVPTCNPTGLPGGEFFETYSYEGPWLAHFLTGGTNVPLPVPQGIIDARDIRRLEKEISTSVLAARGQSSQNLWEDVAQYKQTVRLFSGPIRYLWNFFRKNGASMSLMGPASAWLAYRYGVRPFVEDVTTIVSGLDLPVGIRRDTTRKSQEIRELSMTSASVGDSASSTDVNIMLTDTVTCRGMSVDEHMARLHDNIGFSAKGLITVPWDLIPWSFVLDWFVNVGDYLKAFSPAPGYKQIGGCITTERVISALYTPTNTVCTAPGYTLLRPLTGACSSTVWTKLRQPLSAPEILIKSDFRFSSLIRVADSIALLSQVASKYFR